MQGETSAMLTFFELPGMLLQRQNGNKLTSPGNNLQIHHNKAHEMTKGVCVLHCGAACTCSFPKITVNICGKGLY